MVVQGEFERCSLLEVGVCLVEVLWKVDSVPYRKEDMLLETHPFTKTCD